jgi:hypothetical protein
MNIYSGSHRIMAVWILFMLTVTRSGYQRSQSSPREFATYYSLPDTIATIHSFGGGGGANYVQIQSCNVSSLLPEHSCPTDLCKSVRSITSDRGQQSIISWTVVYHTILRDTHIHLHISTSSLKMVAGGRCVSLPAFVWLLETLKTKLRGFSLRANYTERATACCWRS